MKTAPILSTDMTPPKTTRLTDASQKVECSRFALVRATNKRSLQEPYVPTFSRQDATPKRAVSPVRRHVQTHLHAARRRTRLHSRSGPRTKFEPSTLRTARTANTPRTRKQQHRLRPCVVNPASQNNGTRGLAHNTSPGEQETLGVAQVTKARRTGNPGTAHTSTGLDLRAPARGPLHASPLHHRRTLKTTAPLLPILTLLRDDCRATLPTP